MSHGKTFICLTITFKKIHESIYSRHTNTLPVTDIHTYGHAPCKGGDDCLNTAPPVSSVDNYVTQEDNTEHRLECFTPAYNRT